jgi:hypothetical protein
MVSENVPVEEDVVVVRHGAAGLLVLLPHTLPHNTTHIKIT